MQPRRLPLLSVCGPIQRKQQTCPSSTAVLIWLVHVFVSILTVSPNTTFCLNSRLPEDKHKKQFERQPEEVTWRTLTNLRNVIFSWPQLTPITLEIKEEHLQASTPSQTAFTVIYFSHHTSSASKIKIPCTWPKGFPPPLKYLYMGISPQKYCLIRSLWAAKFNWNLSPRLSRTKNTHVMFHTSYTNCWEIYAHVCTLNTNFLPC